jgi:hypothetical protein
MTAFLDRLVRAARLDSCVYEEIEADQGAFWQAFGVVAFSGMATVVGITGRFNLAELLSGFGLGVLGWAAWSAIAYLVGAQIFPEPQTRADWGELLRTTGFATAPGILSILGIIPVFAGFITLVASVWILLSFTVAVRQALDYTSTLRSVGVCLIGWLLYAGMLFGVMPRASASGFIAGAGTSTRPSIVRLEPDSGKPGDTITAYGRSLDSSTVENIYLTDGTVTALVNIIEQNVTSIRFRIPTMLERGRYTVVVRPAARYATALAQPVSLTVN